MKAINILKIITIINVLVASGFSIAGAVNAALIVPAGVAVNQGTMTFAFYAAARTIPIAYIAIYIIIKRQNEALFTIALLVSVIQLLDAFVGFYQHDASKIIGPIVLSFTGFAALYFAKRALN